MEQKYQTRLLTGEPPCITYSYLSSKPPCILVHGKNVKLCEASVGFIFRTPASTSVAYVYASHPIYREEKLTRVLFLPSPTDPVFGMESARSSLTGKTAHGVQSIFLRACSAAGRTVGSSRCQPLATSVENVKSLCQSYPCRRLFLG